MRDSSERFCPFCQQWLKMVPRMTASGLWMGSASTPTNESSELTVLSIRSPSSSPSSRTSKGGTSRELKMDTGMPALLPGVNMFTSTLSRNSLTLSGLCPHEPMPSFHMVAVFSANSSGVLPFLAASSSLIQGLKSEGSKSGKLSIKFEMSPLGSMTIAGMLSIAASSRIEIQRPVLPDPVMPSTTPWVTRSLES